MTDNTNAVTVRQKHGEAIADNNQVAVIKGDVEAVPARTIRADLDRQLQMMEENYGEAGATPGDFVHARTAKSPNFCIKGLRRDDEPIDDPVGLILHVQPNRALWPDEDEKADRPLCKSDDCITGVGVGGKTCDFAKFSPSGDPPACRERRHL
jgi:hypothetical protein